MTTGIAAVHGREVEIWAVLRAGRGGGAGSASAGSLGVTPRRRASGSKVAP